MHYKGTVYDTGHKYVKQMGQKEEIEPVKRTKDP